MLPKGQSKLSARGDGGGVCGGVGRRQLVRAFCSNVAASSFGFFAPSLVAGLNCAFRGSSGRFPCFLEVVCRLRVRPVVSGAICGDEREDSDSCGR